MQNIHPSASSMEEEQRLPIITAAMAHLFRAVLLPQDHHVAALFIPPDLRTALISPASPPPCSSSPESSLPLLLPTEYFKDFKQDLPLYHYLAWVLMECEEVMQMKTNVVEHLNIFKELMSRVKYRLHVEEPFFSQLKDGTKRVEGRCSNDTYDNIKPGDLILFNDVFIQVVENVIHYRSFKEMLETEGLYIVLPGVDSIAEGVLIYRRFYSEEKEIAKGVIGIHLQHFPEEKQPLAVIENILQEIGVKELESLKCAIVQALSYTRFPFSTNVGTHSRFNS